MSGIRASTILIALIGSVLAPHALGEPPRGQASFQGLGVLGTSPAFGTYSRATGISADGRVVVDASTSQEGQVAYYWTEAISMRALGGLPSGVVGAVFDRQPAVPEAEDRQDRGEGHQPLRG